MFVRVVALACVELPGCPHSSYFFVENCFSEYECDMLCLQHSILNPYIS